MVDIEFLLGVYRVHKLFAMREPNNPELYVFIAHPNCKLARDQSNRFWGKMA